MYGADVQRKVSTTLGEQSIRGWLEQQPSFKGAHARGRSLKVGVHVYVCRFRKLIRDHVRLAFICTSTVESQDPQAYCRGLLVDLLQPVVGRQHGLLFDVRKNPRCSFGSSESAVAQAAVFALCKGCFPYTMLRHHCRDAQVSACLGKAAQVDRCPEGRSEGLVQEGHSVEQVTGTGPDARHAV